MTTMTTMTTMDDHDDRRARANARTTRMLLLVVVLFLVTEFLVTEFPQGITNLLNGLLDHFVDEVYASLGDLLDILALTNNGVNFFLYCTMSKQFRDTFVHLFIAGGCCRSLRSSSSDKRSVGDGLNQATAVPLEQLGTAITLTTTTRQSKTASPLTVHAL